MPHYATKPAGNSLDMFFVNAVQYAHLLHEIRRKSSMSVVFHLANVSHWMEMKTERLDPPVDIQTRDLASLSMSSLSCKLLLQIVRYSAVNQSTGLTHLYATADIELESLIATHKRMADTQSRAPTAFEGLDIFSICIYMVGRCVQKMGHSHLHTDPVIRTCLRLMSIISERLHGVQQLLDVLWLFIDLASNDGTDVEADILRLTRQYHDSDSNLPRSHLEQMRLILVRRAEGIATDEWARIRRGTLP